MVSQGAAARRSAIGPLVMVGLGALALLSPAIANGYPFLYFDTETYHQVGRDAARDIGLLLGGQAIPAGGYIDYTGGRSPYYSLFVYMGATAAGMWVIAAVQALITAWLLYVIARCVAPARPLRAFALVVAGLAVASTLPFYAAFAMPDIMTGWAILAPAALALWLDRLSLPERIGLVVVAAFGLTTHATNPVLASLALVILAVAAFVLRLNVDAPRKRAAWAVAPVVTAMAMSAGYTAARAALFDVEVRNPPYLMARVLADGPAHDYLQKVCAAGAGLEICRYKDKALVYHGDILWSANPEAGVFQLADDEGKRRLVDQEFEFVVGAVMAHPLRQAVRSAKNSLAQLVTFAPSRDFSPARRVWIQMQFAAEIPGETAAATAALAYR